MSKRLDWGLHIFVLRVMALPLLLFITVSFLGSVTQAMWGSGLMSGSQACNYEVQVSEEAESLKEELNERRQELKEAKSEQRKLKSKISSLRTSIASKKDLFKLTGFVGQAFSTIDTHISSAAKCSNYNSCSSGISELFVESPNKRASLEKSSETYLVTNRENLGSAPRPSRAPADAACDSGYTWDTSSRSCVCTGTHNAKGECEESGSAATTPTATSSGTSSPPALNPVPPPYSATACTSPDGALSSDPFNPHVWQKHCGPGDGELKESICEVNLDRPQSYNNDSCRKYLNEWVEKQKELREAILEEAMLAAKVKELEVLVKIGRKEYQEAQKEFQRELRESMTEGNCENCFISGGSVMAPRKTSPWEIAGNVALGIGAMALGNNLNKYAIEQSAINGKAASTYPAFGFGYPYFMGALQGAVGGSLGAGGMACSGSQLNPSYNIPSSMWAYPGGIQGQLQGNVFLPGIGPNGTAGPYGQALCITWPCPVSGNTMGGIPGLGAQFGMGGSPFVFPGMGGIPGLGAQFGMGGQMYLDPMQMQMQQQMLQMQMQMQQQQAQMAYQYQQRYMAGQQTLMTLNQELQTIISRIRQVEYSLQTGGYNLNPISNGGIPGSQIPGYQTPGYQTPGYQTPGYQTPIPGTSGPPQYR